MKRDEVRLSHSQAVKLWDRAFATSWPEVGEGHPARSAMVKLARFLGEEEALAFIDTGQLDVTRGMALQGVRRVQEAAEGTVQGTSPDAGQADRMAQLAFATGQPVSGSY